MICMSTLGFDVGVGVTVGATVDFTVSSALALWASINSSNDKSSNMVKKFC